MKRLDERSSESRMLEIGTYGSMRGGKKKKRSLALCLSSRIFSAYSTDYLRPNTHHFVRLLADEVIRRPSIVLCEPIQFELLRLAPQNSRKILELTLSTTPMLQTPLSLWREATKNGQRCRDKGIQTGALDLLIATICQHHRVTLVTFDPAFEKIADTIGFQIEFIKK